MQSERKKAVLLNLRKGKTARRKHPSLLSEVDVLGIIGGRVLFCYFFFFTVFFFVVVPWGRCVAQRAKALCP